MNDAARHIVKARESLGFARYALAGEYTEEAGRSAYMAAYHAALAFTAARSGKSPRTHSGARSEFARLAREEPRVSREQISLLHAWRANRDERTLEALLATVNAIAGGLKTTG